jgi:hypothetical protein
MPLIHTCRHVISYAYGVALLALLTACGSNPEGKPIAGPASTPTPEAPRDAVPVAGAPNTSAPVVTPHSSSSDAGAAVAITTIPVPVPPLPALPVPSLPPSLSLTNVPPADNGSPGSAQNGGTPVTITQTDVGPVTTGQPQDSAGVDVQDNFIYYPAYGVYFSGRSRLYHYPQRDGWAARPEPEGINVNILRASPSVPMEFHDAPSHHHAAVVQQYPKTWSPGPAHEAPHSTPGPQHDDHK